MKEVEKILARGKSLFTFRGVIKLYNGMDLNEGTARTFNKSQQLYDYWDTAPFTEYVLVQYRRYEVILRFYDEAITYQMNEKTGEFKLVDVAHDGLINLSMTQMRAALGKISEAIREALLDAVGNSDSVE